MVLTCLLDAGTLSGRWEGDRWPLVLLQWNKRRQPHQRLTLAFNPLYASLDWQSLWVMSP
jgi:hypothetical protein